jgi:triphosphoribosyl-dephospho-CoA synthase
MTTGQLATLACMLEATIPKPGNVHRSADFADTTLQDFLVSAIAIGPAMDQATDRPLGRTILDAARATRAAVTVNTNLGLILLLAPLASASAPSVADVEARIAASDADDCRMIYEAIALMQPGGLGSAERYDVAGEAPLHILEAMQDAAARDTIARQYVNGFRDVLEFVLPAIELNRNRGMSLTDAVIRGSLQTMAEYPDSLIARKTGMPLAEEAAARAARVLDCGLPDDPRYLSALEDLDFWLRSDGNRRNPGTTADLVGAALFAGLRTGRITL